jgi:predicted enzyme related to lactoylglutathione lyase
MHYALGIVSLYVRDLDRARAFYTETLGLPEVPELSGPGFIALRPAGGSLIAVQDAATGAPGLAGAPGGCELGLAVADVDAVWREWTARGVRILSEPVDRPFGRTFLAQDPEGHLLNVYRPADR